MGRSLRYEAVASVVPGGRAEATALDETILLDVESEHGPLAAPEHLLAAAFAACLLKSLQRAATFLRFRYERASVHVVLERHGTPRTISRIQYELLLDTDEPAGRVDLVHRNLLRFGAVTSTLALSCEIAGRVVVSESVLSETAR